MVTPGIVRRTLGNIKMGQAAPAWLDTVARLYPPVTFTEPAYMRGRGKKVARPPKLVYAEDAFRRRFFRENPSEAYAVTRVDENAPMSDAERVFVEQSKYIEQGIDAEQAYKLAVADYRRQRARHEMQQRVAQEQQQMLQDGGALPCSAVLEALLMEEREALAKAD